MKKLSDCDLFLVDEFKQIVQNGGFNSYDGEGYYSDDGCFDLDIIVDLDNIDINHKYVMWYSK